MTQRADKPAETARRLREGRAALFRLSRAGRTAPELCAAAADTLVNVTGARGVVVGLADNSGALEP
jgi:hypothetical protein